eukprot:scaffold44422_cov242-Isochrysis_galbana.AAC.1
MSSHRVELRLEYRECHEERRTARSGCRNDKTAVVQLRGEQPHAAAPLHKASDVHYSSCICIDGRHDRESLPFGH